MGTESADVLSVDIQDVIIGKIVVPHHIDYGFVNPQEDQLSEVRMIDVPVRVNIRADKSILFQPGKPTSNLECITYSCILLNDLLELEVDLADLIPSEPKEVRIHIDEFMTLVGSDDLPASWFIYYRTDAILQVNVVINFREDLEDLHIDSGTSWASMVESVQSRLKLLELESDKALCDLKKKHDYSKVKSTPAKLAKKTSKDIEPVDLEADFLAEIRSLMS